MTTHRGLSRRSLLAAVGGLAALPMLSSCGSATGSTARLRTAFPVSGARESLDPHTSSLFVDQARAKALFDTLVAYADDMSVEEVPGCGHFIAEEKPELVIERARALFGSA